MDYSAPNRVILFSVAYGVLGIFCIILLIQKRKTADAAKNAGILIASLIVPFLAILFTNAGVETTVIIKPKVFIDLTTRSYISGTIFQGGHINPYKLNMAIMWSNFGAHPELGTNISLTDLMSGQDGLLLLEKCIIDSLHELFSIHWLNGGPTKYYGKIPPDAIDKIRDWNTFGRGEIVPVDKLKTMFPWNPYISKRDTSEWILMPGLENLYLPPKSTIKCKPNEMYWRGEDHLVL